PPPRETMAGHNTEDQESTCLVCDKANRVLLFRTQTLLQPNRHRAWNRWIDRSGRQRLHGIDDLRRVRQHPIVIPERDHDLPVERHGKRYAAVLEAVEVQRAVEAGETGDQLK